MNNWHSVNAISDAARSERFHRWRARKDLIARRVVNLGGISVIVAVVLIFFYLIWAVLPLFLPVKTELHEIDITQNWQNSPAVFLSLEEQQTIGMHISKDRRLTFFELADGRPIVETLLPTNSSAVITRVREAQQANGWAAVTSSDGAILVFRHQYETRFDSGVESKQILPSIDFPFGEKPVLTMPTGDISAVTFSVSADEMLLAATQSGPDAEAISTLVRIQQAMINHDVANDGYSLTPQLRDLEVGFAVTALAVSGNHRWLYLGDDKGQVHRYDLPELQPDQLVKPGKHAITSMSMLLGGISLLVGDSEGVIRQLFPVRKQNNEFDLTLIREFEALGSPIVKILSEQRRKGFLALSAENELAIFNSTAGQQVHRQSLARIQPQTLALSPRANGLLIKGRDQSLSLLQIENKHPAISFSTLWQKVWYENHPEPEYLWQSSAANNDFEPKFSLTPLVFGTLKAAIYAMLFAIPLALMAAAYTAYFMSPGIRKWIKPAIELMAALPTVILGFVAGLWFAPFLEENLSGILMLLLVLPTGILLSAWFMHRYELRLKSKVFEGREALVQIPVILFLVLLALGISDPVQSVFFQGDLRDWLSTSAGISYDQRNAFVVGCAMGFAVIPTIFTIAEDAIFGVPKSLFDGSLALGATRWQSMVRVVLPTASPGIFSALMIGLGRAVGETMIVLMATGNTPIMDWNLFEGMRTLAANIAVEMPESAVGGSHFRVLFLAALVLFMFTFVVNTLAEIVRQRLRLKYSSL